MTTGQNPVLLVEPGVDSFHVRCLEPGPAPTVNVSAGDNITVEVDLARPEAPVSVTIHDTEAAAVNLCDLFGIETARELLRRQSDTTQADVTLPFTPGPGWGGLVAAAYQQWTIFWNPLPIDGALFALDTVAAAQQNGAFDGTRTARSYAEEALPAARTLQRLMDAGQIAEVAMPVVRTAVEAVNRNLLPGTPEPDTIYTIPLPQAEPDRDAILYAAAPYEAASQPGLLVIGSPDWRLSGHGRAATSEDTIHVKVHARNPHAITITTPLKAGTSTGAIDGYEAFITEPATGHVIAHARLKSDGESLHGHALPLRPIRPTDHVDVRHTSLEARPETDPRQRKIDRVKRDSARKLIHDRLERPTYDGMLPATLNELALMGLLLAPLEAANKEEVDDFELFLFTLTDNLVTQRTARSGGDISEKIWTAYSSSATGSKVYVEDRGDKVRLWLKDFQAFGAIRLKIVVSVTFETPDGPHRVESNPAVISTRRSNHYVYLDTPFPGALIHDIRVRVMPADESQ